MRSGTSSPYTVNCCFGLCVMYSLFQQIRIQHSLVGRYSCGHSFWCRPNRGFSLITVEYILYIWKLKRYNITCKHAGLADSLVAWLIGWLMPKKFPFNRKFSFIQCTHHAIYRIECNISMSHLNINKLGKFQWWISITSTNSNRIESNHRQIVKCNCGAANLSETKQRCVISNFLYRIATFIFVFHWALCSHTRHQWFNWNYSL